MCSVFNFSGVCEPQQAAPVYIFHLYFHFLFVNGVDEKTGNGK